MKQERILLVKQIVKTLLMDAIILSILAVVFFQLSVYFKIYYTPTNSMDPTIKVGDVTIGLKPSEIKRGDIVTYIDHEENKTIVKRVIGLPGETVSISDSQLYINGEALSEPYVSSPEISSMEPQVLKDGEYFLAGDNRQSSLDSRQKGAISRNSIKHVISYRILPFDSIGKVNTSGN